jgi:hypothetical protein
MDLRVHGLSSMIVVAFGIWQQIGKEGSGQGCLGLTKFLVFLYSFEVLIKLVIDVSLEGSDSNQGNLTLAKMSLMSEKHTIS